MKIRCPKCDTTYDVSNEIATSGAQVQCAKCADIFTAVPIDDEPQPPRETPVPLAEETVTPAEPETLSEQMTPAEAESESKLASKGEPEQEPAGPVDEKTEDEPDLDIAFAPADEAPVPLAKTAVKEETPPDLDIAFVPAPPQEDKEEAKDETEEEPALDIAFAETADEPQEPALAKEPEAEPKEELDADLLSDEEKDFFASFGARLAQEEQQKQALAESVIDETPSPAAPADMDFDKFPEPAEEELFVETEPTLQQPAEPLPTAPAPAATGPATRLPRNLLIGWGALAASLLILITGATLFRVPIVKALPGMAGIYETVGLPVNIRGLEFYGLSHQWMNDHGRMRLVVRGEIGNITDSQKPVPEIVFAMMDGSGHEFFQWTERPRTRRLPAYSKIRFRAQIPAPADRVHKVKIHFAKR